MKSLSGGDALDAVTIIGTKYHAGAHDYIIRASRLNEAEEQCLFLLVDPKSQDVMLHNGKQRLGTVAPVHADRVRTVLTRVSKSHGVDHVLVCKHPFVTSMSNGEMQFKRNSSLNVTPVYHIYERLARKFSNKYRKD